jgi:beta-lactamase regulating signal transducer with metallopeptidase domain
MIAAWMVYATAITLLLCAGAAAAEYLARALGVPTRFVWVAAALFALGMSGSALATERESSRAPAAAVVRNHASSISIAVAPAASRTTTGAQRARVSPPNAIHNLLTIVQRGIEAARLNAGRLGIARLDTSRLERWNVALVAVWLVGSALAVAYLILSFVSVRRIRRRLAVAVVDEHTVLLSDDVGPALFGLVRARIVVPRWVLTLPAAERRIILAHEQEHAAAFDPALLWGAAILLALAPWNVGLWLLCARLRLALEADCDRRVLGVRGDVRGYGELLVSVHERVTRGPMPHVAFGERRTNLERRVRRMVYRPRLVSMSGGAAVLGVVVLATAAWTAPVPVVRHRGNEVATAVVIPVLSPMRSASTAAIVGVPATRFGAIQAQQVRRLPAMTTVANAPSSPASQREDCGFGVRSGELCSADGTILIRLVDSSHVAIAIHDRADTGAAGRIDELFLITSLGPMQGVTSQLIPDGHAEFQGGSLYVLDRSHTERRLVFAARSAWLAERHPEARHIEPLIGIAEYPRSQLTFDLIRALVPGVPCPEDSGRVAALHGSVGQVVFIGTPGKPAPSASTAPATAPDSVARKGDHWIVGRSLASPLADPLYIVDGVVVPAANFRIHSAESAAPLPDTVCYEAGGTKIIFP